MLVQEMVRCAADRLRIMDQLIQELFLSLLKALAFEVWQDTCFAVCLALSIILFFLFCRRRRSRTCSWCPHRRSLCCELDLSGRRSRRCAVCLVWYRRWLRNIVPIVVCRIVPREPVRGAFPYSFCVFKYERSLVIEVLCVLDHALEVAFEGCEVGILSSLEFRLRDTCQLIVQVRIRACRERFRYMIW